MIKKEIRTFFVVRNWWGLMNSLFKQKKGKKVYNFAKTSHFFFFEEGTDLWIFFLSFKAKELE